MAKKKVAAKAKKKRVQRRQTAVDSGGWIEDEGVLETILEAVQGYVETLPDPPPRRRKRADHVKIGWASERVNRRART